MPEFDWHWGYPLSIMLIAFAAIGSYLFFLWKKWLKGTAEMRCHTAAFC